MTEIQSILSRIVELEKAILGRCLALQKSMPEAISQDEIDRQEIVVWRAKLELAREQQTENIHEHNWTPVGHMEGEKFVQTGGWVCTCGAYRSPNDYTFEPETMRVPLEKVHVRVEPLHEPPLEVSFP